MDFESAYQNFLVAHISARTGERLSRIVDGLGHAEKLFLQEVWWPTFGQFEWLSPEYLVRDYDGGDRYIDFAYVNGNSFVAIEIDGYGSHQSNISRRDFAASRRRQNMLVIDGWRVLRFAYDDVRDRPKSCSQAIQQLLGRWGLQDQALRQTSVMEREIIRLALRTNGPIKPQDVSARLGLHLCTARDLLHQLVEKNWLEPVGGGTVRVRSYQLHSSRRGVVL